ncbi:hypothetical protein PCASD_14714 [Puccinia coronata f. sp. avenae]|uniref:Uncharacterized protein n=1 Tax=Puccinia coronata f. sp. avenae TaxID=200324 RepID=A0A2N5TD39_9BASI|nr:hypothetical protein PCASD_14714 [Puccinia coronata f. sp. avenae]
MAHHRISHSSGLFREAQAPAESSVEVVTKENIAKYVRLKIGVVQWLVGKSKALFRKIKRIFDPEKASVSQHNNQAEEEIRFRSPLRFSKSSTIYGQQAVLVN